MDANSNLESQMDTTDTFEISSIHSTESSTESAESGISSCAANDESFNSLSLSTKTDTEEGQGSQSTSPIQQQQFEVQDQQLTKLLADINKMKRRCKHILDVTDHVSYCC